MSTENTINNLIQAAYSLADEVAQLRAEAKKTKGNNQPKLSATDVKEIYQYDAAGFSQREIARMYDVNPSTISRTVRGFYNR